MLGMGLVGIANRRKLRLGRLGERLLLLVLMAVLGGCLGSRDRPLQLVHGADPQYPVEARQAGVEGYVTLSYAVSKEGLVSNVRVVASEPAGVFDAAAIAAVQRWHYKAPQLAGEPVAADRVTSTLRFELASPEQASKYDGY